MGLGPLAQPLFYQYNCIIGSAKASCIKRSDGSLLTDAGQIQSDGHNQSPGLSLPSQSSAILLEYLAPQPRACPPCAPSPHPRAGAEGGGGCLTSATAQLWQVQNSRRRLEPSLRSLVKPQGTSRSSTSSTVLLALGRSGWPDPSRPGPRTAVRV